MKPRILLSSWVAPIPSTSGGAQRTNLLYKALAEIADVDFVLLSLPAKYTAQDMKVMREEFRVKACRSIKRPQELAPWKYLPFPRRIRNQIANNIDGSRSLLREQPKLRRYVGSKIEFNSYDLIVGRYAKSLTSLGLHHQAPMRLALDVDDWDLDVYESRKRAMKNILKKKVLDWHIHNVKNALPPLINSLSTIWVSNKENLDEPLLARARLLPNIPFLEDSNESQQTPFPGKGEIITTIGCYAHYPNVMGIDWFLGNVWPSVLNNRPGARFKIHGSGLDSVNLKERWQRHPHVEVIGFVGKVEDAYKEAMISVCTVSEGAGTNIKVLESLRLGRPCVSTLKGANGFDELVEIGGLVPCQNEQEMIASIVDLLENREKAKQLGARASKKVKNEFNFSAFSKVVSEGVETALSAPKPSV
ncbi:glycosyltransferase family 4 protein [Puniceicoccaceae bacterium K14]|nr:glycosyltransferase family 4 protein [Puniceicoccaceae bacterium K14]